MSGETIANDPNGINGAVNYSYDPVGNRTQLTSTLAPVPAGLWNYDANDRFTAGDTYDANGNTISSGGIGVSYDFENRLIQKGGVTLIYDGDGNRVAKTVGGVTTRYLVANSNPTGYPQVIAEATVNGAPTVPYVYGLERISQKRTVLINGSNTTQIRYFDYDGHGSVRALTDTTGNVTDTYDYDAFGNLIHSMGTTQNIYLYSGEQFDSDLNLYYNRARYLSVSVGRFWSADAFEGVEFDPTSLHRYLYASANPVDRVDPGGHEDADLASNLVSTAGLTIVKAIAIVSTVAVVCDVDYALGGDLCTGREQRQGRMRVQLQLGAIFTVPNTPVLVNQDPPGVTILQVRGALESVYAIAQGDAARFPFNKLESDLVTAVIEINQQAGAFAPLGFNGFKRGLLTAPIADSGWRIDVDNLEGTNLRQ